MTIAEFLEIVKKKWHLLVIFPVVFGLLAGIFCWGFMTDNYTSSTTVYVLNKSEQKHSDTVSYNEVTVSQQLSNDIAELAKSDRVKKAIMQDTGMSSLAGYSFAVSSTEKNRVIKMSVTGKRPESVAQVADSLARQTATLAVEIMDVEAVNIVDDATVPTVPSGPNRVLYTAIAVVVGFIVAILLILLLDILDTTVKTKEQLEDKLGLPLLSQVPLIKKLK